MNTNIYHSENLQILWDKTSSLFEIILTHHSHQELELKADLLKFVELVEQYRPTKNLWNLNKFEITIGLELQEWIDFKVNSRELELGVTHEAFLTSDDLIHQISIEQTMDETHGKNIKSKFFSDHGEAVRWLLAH